MPMRGGGGPGRPLDDADLVGDLECVEVLGETYVRLLLAVRPAKQKHQSK